MIASYSSFDPIQNHSTPFTSDHGQRPVVIANASRPKVADLFEVNGWVARVTQPQLKIFPGQRADFRR
jgi:hypothetical protein